MILNCSNIRLSLSGSRTSAGDGCLFHLEPRASDLTCSGSSESLGSPRSVFGAPGKKRGRRALLNCVGWLVSFENLKQGCPFLSFVPPCCVIVEKVGKRVVHLFSRACGPQSEGCFLDFSTLCTWEERAELCLVGLFLLFSSHRRSSTGDTSLSIRSHVAFAQKSQKISKPTASSD